MKKILALVCSVALMGICSLATAQVQDTASTNIDTQPPIEQQGEDTQSDDVKTREAEDQSADQQLQNDVDAMERNFEGSTIDKVGPNGEELFMERGKYYYINDEGKKVKVKKSEVRDKSEEGDTPRL